MLCIEITLNAEIAEIHRDRRELERRWNECRVEPEWRWERRRSWTHSGAHPRVNRADRRQDLRPGQVAVTDSGRESLEQQFLFTRRRIQFRIRRLISNHQQRIDDRVHAENRIADLA